ncbi:MAG: nucleotidyltransferase domain-containing protein [Candidatus Hydrogenedentes bacterium]|nr:nucleotidyltransferase domain-containing protein [Candidatus Hydrogenedentota bacterium]
MTLKTSGLVDILKEHLDSEAIQVAFVFGSVAQGRERAESDIDLMVIGSNRVRRVAPG